MQIFNSKLNLKLILKKPLKVNIMLVDYQEKLSLRMFKKFRKFVKVRVFKGNDFDVENRNGLIL